MFAFWFFIQQVMASINIGPLSFSMPLLGTLIAMAVGLFTAAWQDRRHHTRSESLLTRLLVLAMVAGRAGFVVQHLDSYLASPLAMLDIRDGGFSVLISLAVFLVGVGAMAWRRQPLRRPLLISSVAGLCVLGIVYALMHLYGPQQGKPVENIELHDLDGQRININDFQGKPAVVNLWATWCPPCRREMPVLAESQQANPHINYVFANQRETAETIRDYLREENIDLDNILIDDRGKLAQVIKSNGLPTTLFLDKQGRLVDVRLGELSRATLQDRVQALSRGDQTPLPVQE